MTRETWNWYRRFPKDFRDGTRHLSLEVRGAYSELLDMMYEANGPIAENDKLIAHAMCISKRKWESIKETLRQDGKIIIRDGIISNVRASTELENRAKTSRKISEKATKRERKSRELSKKVNEINGSDAASCFLAAETRAGTELEREKREKEREELTSFSNGESESGEQAAMNAALTVNYEKEDSVSFSNGRLMLHNGCRQQWLDHFGGDSIELELALTQAAGYVQPHNRSKSLRVQTEAQLARILRDKRDKDARYAAAASKNRKPDKQANDDAWLDNLKSQIAAKGRQEVRPADLD